MAGKSLRHGEGRSNSSPFSFFTSGDASGKDKDSRTHTTAPADISTSLSGGDYTNTPGDGYKYHTFITPGQILHPVSVTDTVCDILVIAGGGGGGAHYGAGGGAGGVALGIGITLTAQAGPFPVGVGTGGIGANREGSSDFFDAGVPGGNSHFGQPGTGIAGQPDYILAKGGGGGGGSYYSHPDGSGPGRPGGSAGGASGGDEPPADASATQPGTNPSPFITDYGSKGGWSTPTGGYAPSGGGGAGAAGANIDGDEQGGGNGGTGITIPQFPHAKTGVAPLIPESYEFQLGGPTTFQQSGYAGGGGGSRYSAVADPDRNCLGGDGGGGFGSFSETGTGAGEKPTGLPNSSTQGLDYTGSGGGGHKSTTNSGVSRQQNRGGHGVVIIRYQV